MKLYGYIRVSTDDQAVHGHSLEIQRRKLAAYCDAHDCTLVAVHADEGVSASVPLAQRPAGRAMMLGLQGGGAQGIVTVALDRLWRDVFDGVSTMRSLEHLQVSLHSLREHIATDTPAGRLQVHLLLATAQYEREVSAERTRSTMRALQEQGRVYGHVPYGCVARDGQLYRDPHVWPTRGEIVAMRSAGLSLREMRAQLRRQHVAPPNGATCWPLSTLANLVDTHHRLECLPMASAAPEAAVSEAA